MDHPDLDAFLDVAAPDLIRAPGAIVFAEDEVELASTLATALGRGFGTVALLCAPTTRLPEGFEETVHRIPLDIHADEALTRAINQVIARVPGAWLHYCYNAEYLFFPFCETRSVRELLAFHAEERRDAMLTYVIDLYAEDLDKAPNAVALDSAMLDRSGYYALGRQDPANGWKPMDRQMDCYGGLRWRFEEHVPWTRRRIDRISLFRAQQGLKLLPDHRFNIEEYNTFACPWHNNLTTALCSFRTAKALRTNPGSRFDIHSFVWRNSVRFEWKSQQLLDLGLMEPGQWF